MKLPDFSTREDGKTWTEIQQASVHGKHKRARTLILQLYTRTHDPPPTPTPTLTLLTYNPLCHHLALSP